MLALRSGRPSFACTASVTPPERFYPQLEVQGSSAAGYHIRDIMNEILNKGIRHARRVIVAVIGATVLFAGVFMIVLPGPAVIVIPAGLAILASEFLWARRLLRKVKNSISEKPSKEN
ncbi:MAG: PGPGW domain-containing protein [Betaproteobacteria bacterium]